jgi:hypothetical protein
MRKVTEQIVRAFRNRERKTIGNSSTDGTALYLHGNKIAEFRNQELWISNAGWQSNTTKERLNGLAGVSVVQRRGQWYLNGLPWDGEWVQVSTFGHEWQAVDTEPETVEFDMTSEWKGSYSKPLYAVYHTHEKETLEAVEKVLSDAGIPNRRHETDTTGEYKPNHFVVVLPADVERAKRLTDEL